MQTNKEFFDALNLPPEDDFLAIAVRRIAAKQLAIPVVELETQTNHLPDFSFPWDIAGFAFALEKELGIQIPNENFRTNLETVPQKWFRGPAIEMPMDSWTKITVQQLLAPIRNGISCPENWSPFEPEKLIPSKSTTWTDWLIFGFVFLFLTPFLLIPFFLLGRFFQGWADVMLGPIALAASWLAPIGLLYCVLKIQLWFDDTTKRTPQKPLIMLLGTLTLENQILHFFDDTNWEGSLEVIPGDYRVFLIYKTKNEDWAEYAVFSNRTEIPDYDTLVDFVVAQRDDLDQPPRKIVAISLCDITEIKQLSWKPQPNPMSVTEIGLRKDRTVGGLKLYPIYVDGGDFAHLRKDETDCEIILELGVLDE